MKTMLAHTGTAIAILLLVRAYTFWFILPAARQAAFLDRVKDISELVSQLDQRYIHVQKTNSVDHLTIRKD